MTHTTYAVTDLRGGRPGTPEGVHRIYDLGADIYVRWSGLAPFGRGYGGHPYGASAYGGVPDPAFRGYRVEVRLALHADGAAPWKLVRRDYVREPWYVYRETDNRADTRVMGGQFQSKVRFDVFPWTTRGTGTGATYVTPGGGVTPGCKLDIGLACLNDVSLTGVVDGDTLVFNSGTGMFEPGAGGGGGGGLTVDLGFEEDTVSTTIDLGFES